jgi:hypothetical protein
MTIRVYNGQTTTNSQLVWRNRNGVSVLEPELGWVNPTTIKAYYKSLIPRDRRSLVELLALAEIEKSAEEELDDMVYEQAMALNRANQNPLT